jgi:hypothetical protein
MGRTNVTTARPKIGDFLVRAYMDDGKLHLYLKSELADSAYRTLIPWCQLDKIYPDRHPRPDVPRNAMARHGFCLGCSLAFERTEASRGKQP